MTSRPGRIKDVVTISLPFPRDLHSPEAVRLRARLWEVCQLAALHFAAAAPNCVTYEAMFIESLLMEIFTEPFPRPSQRYIPVPQRPDLELDVDAEKVARFRVL